MSRPQPQQYTLTDAEARTLTDLINSEDGQGIEDFFKAMPEEKARAILTQLVTGMLVVSAAHTITDILRQIS